MRLIFLLMIFYTLNGLSQNAKISGLVKDKRGQTLPGANIFIKGSYDGVSSDTCGRFMLSTSLKGPQILCVRFIGYQSFEQAIDINNYENMLTVVLKEETNNLATVVIRAGVFEANDEKKAVLLKPLDVVTTASAVGDIYGALQTLPGLQQVGEDGSLFVRGGDKSESRTFFDGLNVDKPYQSQVPDLPSRGRFSPFLFKGTLFSTGGYSAEYGQALSSALILNSVDLAERTVTAINLMSIGPGMAHTHRWKTASLSMEGNYYNLKPYYDITKHHYEWTEAPEMYSGQLTFRAKTSETGMFKAFASGSTNQRALLYPDFLNDSKMKHAQQSKNYYGNITFKETIGHKTIIKSGFAFTLDNEKINNTYFDNAQKYASLHTKITAIHNVNSRLTIKSGFEHAYTNFREQFLLHENIQRWNNSYTENLTAGFAEMEISIGRYIAMANGLRVEYEQALQKFALSPRLSLALKTSKNSQISAAYGIFHQTPDGEFLKTETNLQFEKATHYILSFQQSIKGRIARIETYYKNYKNLTLIDNNHNSLIANNGFGYAKGVDIFIKDEKSIPFFDYWLSYSYIDSKRKYRVYPEMVQPGFVSNHNFSVVTKYFVRKITTSFGMTYSHGSSRPYNNPNNAKFMNEWMPGYHDLSVNFSYITQVWGCYTVVHGSVSNVPGFERNFGYRYSTRPDAIGLYRGYPITADSKRFFLLAIFINI